MFFRCQNATRIGIAGAHANSKGLFEIGAKQASETTGARVRIVWLAGNHGRHVHARIVVEGSAVVPSTSDTEVVVRLKGESTTDLLAVKRAIIEILHRLC